MTGFLDKNGLTHLWDKKIKTLVGKAQACSIFDGIIESTPTSITSATTDVDGVVYVSELGTFLGYTGDITDESADVQYYNVFDNNLIPSIQFNTSIVTPRGYLAVSGMLYKDASTGNMYIATGSESNTVLTLLSTYLSELGQLTQSVTWEELCTLRDNSNLVPGVEYRITDYKCTTTQSGTQSAGNQFDIIVVADDVNKLNEKARACLHEGDTYFASCKLEAWQIWYSLDNDTSRFAWADSTNGKGVIYRMIDEYNNDVPYDFKNIQFKRYKITATTTVCTSFVGYYFAYSTSMSGFTIDSSTYQWFYTFSNSSHTDASLLKAQHVWDNSIKTYIVSNKQTLNNIVFGIIKTACACYCNTFGNNCYAITFGYNCYGNTFGYNCYNNIFVYTCHSNTFGNYCINNNFFRGCHSNTFGNYCTNNTFGNGCQSNTFGNYCQSNTFGNECQSNTFGNECQSNTFGNYCQNNTFGNECYDNTVTTYVEHVIIDDGCQVIDLSSDDTDASNSNYLRNVHICQGVCGEPSSRKTISVPDRNLAYQTEYKAAGSVTMEV